MYNETPYYELSGTSFGEFVDKISGIPNRISEWHFISQSYCLLGKNKEPVVDYVIKFETLEKDFEKIRKKYNLDKLPTINKTRSKGERWEDYYTFDLAKKIYKRYKKDFDIWYPNAYKDLLQYLKNSKK